YALVLLTRAPHLFPYTTLFRSNWIMEQDSSASRASSIASDYFQLGRVLTTEQLEQIIESLSLEEISAYWLAHRPANYRIVTLGPNRKSTRLNSSHVKISYAVFC